MKEYFERKMDELVVEVLSKFDILVEEVQVKLLNPFCNKYNVKFVKDFYSFKFISSDGKSLYKLFDNELEVKYGKRFVIEYNELLDLLNQFIRMNDCSIGGELSNSR